MFCIVINKPFRFEILLLRLKFSTLKLHLQNHCIIQYTMDFSMEFRRKKLFNVATVNNRVHVCGWNAALSHLYTMEKGVFRFSSVVASTVTFDRYQAIARRDYIFHQNFILPIRKQAHYIQIKIHVTPLKVFFLWKSDPTCNHRTPLTLSLV